MEDSILGKLYKLFTAADSGVVDVADAGLSEYEFRGTITIAQLQEVLAPIGGVNLKRIDASISDAASVDIATVFKVLDRNSNDRVTASEFIKLLKTAVPRAHAAGRLLQA